jgi:hypothetical protein
VEAAAARLAHRLSVLPEAAMREAVLVEELGAMPPKTAVSALAELQDGATRFRTPAFLVATATLAASVERLPYAVRRDLYEAAKDADLDGIARLFFAAPPVAETRPEPEQYVPTARRTVTLGERKALARRGRRDLVTALVRDPDATVIVNLLANPRLTEKDVLAVASRRPAPGGVLRAIFASKWVCRYHVKRALVMNPFTPDDVAVRLAGGLIETDLRLVAADAQLRLPVRAQARALLARTP